MADPILELLADAYHQWQYGDNGTHDTLMEAAGVAGSIRNGLLAHPDLLIRLAVEAGALIESSPFVKENHGSGCWYRSGGPCDCTANRAPYYRIAQRPSGQIGANE